MSSSITVSISDNVSSFTDVKHGLNVYQPFISLNGYT